MYVRCVRDLTHAHYDIDVYSYTSNVSWPSCSPVIEEARKKIYQLYVCMAGVMRCVVWMCLCVAHGHCPTLETVSFV